MAAYTIQQFITRAESGEGVSVSAAKDTNIIIDGYPIAIGTTPIDIGQYFSARQILECYPLRAGIVGGVISTSAGVTSLSAAPTI